MKVWTNISDAPVMVPGPDEFDLDLIAMNQVFKYKGRYYASIHGSKAGSKLWANGIAVSDDLRNWKKYPRNPLRPISENKSSGLFSFASTRCTTRYICIQQFRSNQFRSAACVAFRLSQAHDAFPRFARKLGSRSKSAGSRLHETEPWISGDP